MDRTITSFPKMDISMATQFTNASGASSSYTTPVQRKNSKGGSPYPEKTKRNKSNHQERLGAKLAPQATMSYPNSPEHSATLRNTRIVPAKTGLRDFYNKRAYGQNAQ